MQIDVGHGNSRHPGQPRALRARGTAVVAAIGQAALLGPALVLSPAQSRPVAFAVLSCLTAWAALEADSAPVARAPTNGRLPPRLLTVAQAALTFASLWVALATARGPSAAAICVGLTAVGVGVALRIAAIRTLGPLFLDDAGLASHHPRVARGVYARVRHPALGGLLLVTSGAALSTGSVWAASIVTVGLLPLAATRIALEERLFAQQPDDRPVNGL